MEPQAQQYHPYQPPKQLEPVNGCLVAFIIAIALFVPLIGPIASIIVGSINMKRPGGVALLIVGIIMIVLNLFTGLLAAIAVPNFIKAKEKAMEAEVKANTHTFQIALERFATDSGGFYPESMDEIFDKGYMYAAPDNPFTDEATDIIEFGEPNQAGNVTYVPVSNPKGIYGYYLFSYCDTCDGQDVDGDGIPDKVILILISSNNNTGLPKLEDLLD